MRMRMRMRRIMGFFLALVMFMGFLSLNPIVSYANDDANNDVEINSTNFPDKVFRDYVKKWFDKAPRDGKLSERELEQVTMIDLSRRGVSSLKGIEYFTNLKDLWCDENNLTNLDVSKNPNLTRLYCDNNQLTSLDVSHNTELTLLDCGFNQLTHLDVSKNPKLYYLNFYKNNLTKLDISKNTKLYILLCGFNQLTSLDVSKNPKLAGLYCNNNNLTSLDVSKNPDLIELNCDNNRLASLDVSKNPNLTKLYCSLNRLASLDVSKNPNLTILYCNQNRLASLDVSKNPNLTKLYCSLNRLASLDVSKNTNLTILYCAFNQLTSLDVSKSTKLNEFVCHNNHLTSLDVTNNKSIYSASFNFSNQEYDITVSKDKREFKYSEFPGRFDKGKVSQLNGATFNGDALTVNSNNPSEVTYNYDAGNGKVMDVKLNVAYFDLPPTPAPTPTPTPTPTIQRTVTFKDGDKTHAKVKVETGKAIDTDVLTGESMPKDPTKDGYTFKEWNTKENGKGETFTGASVVSGDMTVYAIYTKDSAPTPTPTPNPPAPNPDPTPKPPTPTPELKPQPETPAPKPQPEKRIGMIPKTGESASFEGLLAALGFSIAGLAILLKKKMTKENNK